MAQYYDHNQILTAREAKERAKTMLQTQTDNIVRSIIGQLINNGGTYRYEMIANNPAHGNCFGQTAQLRKSVILKLKDLGYKMGKTRLTRSQPNHAIFNSPMTDFEYIVYKVWID
jgi:hypothetical protein